MTPHKGRMHPPLLPPPQGESSLPTRKTRRKRWLLGSPRPTQGRGVAKHCGLAQSWSRSKAITPSEPSGHLRGRGSAVQAGAPPKQGQPAAPVGRDQTQSRPVAPFGGWPRGWKAAREAERRAGSVPGGRPHKQLGNLSRQAPAASSDAGALSAGRPAGWRGRAPREEREAASTGGSCRFSSWEKPLTAFGERAEGTAGLWMQTGPRHPCGIPSYLEAPPRPRGPGRGRGGCRASQPLRPECTVALNPSP